MQTEISEHLEPTTIMQSHSPSLVPTARSIRATDAGALSMASFGIGEDPDVEARRKRGMIFGVSVAVFLAIAALMISRTSSEPVAKTKEEKPPPAAAAPPPPPAVAERPKDEAKPAASAAPDEKKTADANEAQEDKGNKKGKSSKTGKGHRHRAKAGG